MRKKEPGGCLGLLQRLFAGGEGQPAAERLPYCRRDDLLSRAERSFYGVLRQAVGERYLVFAKVRVADLLAVERGTERYQAHLNRISAKHIDFVLCTPDTVSPVAAVELDDASHRRTSRRERDAFLDAALAAAGLPLVRFPAARRYNTAEVAEAIDSALAPGTGQVG